VYNGFSGGRVKVSSALPSPPEKFCVFVKIRWAESPSTSLSYVPHVTHRLEKVNKEMTEYTVVLNQTLAGQQVRNVLLIDYGGPNTPSGFLDLADYVRSSWVASTLAVEQVNEWSLDSVSLRPCASAGPYATIGFTDGPLVGENVGVFVAQVALLASLLNFGIIPPTRGRIYFAGVTTQALSPSTGLFPNSVLDKVEALVGSWINAVTADAESFNLRIASRASDGTCASTNPIDGVIVRANPATQRRRRLGQGS